MPIANKWVSVSTYQAETIPAPPIGCSHRPKLQLLIVRKIFRVGDGSVTVGKDELNLSQHS